MPFLQLNQTEDPLGKIGSALPPAALLVHPDQVLQLKRRFEDRREQIREFMSAQHDTLARVPPPGTDPCSEHAVQALGENGQTATNALQGFLDELGNVIDSLAEAAKLYGLVQESNSDRFWQEQG